MRGKEVFYACSIGCDVMPRFFLDDYRFDSIANSNCGEKTHSRLIYSPLHCPTSARTKRVFFYAQKQAADLL